MTVAVPRASSTTVTSATFVRVAVEASSGRLGSVLASIIAEGPSLTSVTVSVKTRSIAPALLLVARIRTDIRCDASKSKLLVASNVVPERVNRLLSVSPSPLTRENVVVPSAPGRASVPTKALAPAFSLIVVLESVSSTTCTVTDSGSEAAPWLS